MMNLILDQGNTQLKAAVFKGDKIDKKNTYRNFIESDLELFLDGSTPEKVLVSSVKGDSLLHQMRALYGKRVYHLNHQNPLPFTSLYTTPNTLGLDRIGLAAAAVNQFPRRNCLVIDAGTCVTYDFIDEDKVYHGGAISPGLMMRYQSLSEFTAQLPLIEHQLPQNLIGNSSSESIRSGVVNGLIAEVDGTIAAYMKRFTDVQVVITGGDLQVFEPLLKSTIFAAPNFLLSGLNNILEYYAEVL